MSGDPQYEDAEVQEVARLSQLREESFPRTEDLIQEDLVLTEDEAEALDGVDADFITSEGRVRQRVHKPHVRFTPELKVRFCQLLSKHGTKFKCARAIGIAPMTVTIHERKDKDFRELVIHALEVFADHIESVVIDRAINGWLEPVINHKDGIVVTHVRRFDNRLAELVLKRHRPEYREKQQLDVNVKGGVLIVPASPESLEEWQEKHKQLPEGETNGMIEADAQARPTIESSASNEESVQQS